MLTHYQYEQEIYERLTDLRDQHPDWHFAMRHRAKNFERQRFIGVEGKYFGTTFWNITTDSFTGPAYPVGLYFWYTESGYGYHLEGRQTRLGTTGRDHALLALIDSLLDSEFADRASGRDEENKNQVVYIRAPQSSYTHVEELFKDLHQDLAIFIPLVDEKLQEARTADATFAYRRYTQEDTDKFNQKYASRTANLDTTDDTLADSDATPTATQQSQNSATGAPLNQILYGPPGTGKTYSTIAKAVAIVNPAFISANRTALRQEYLRLKKAKQIVFTTFHQSLSYEDFVEGLKPKLGTDDENEEIGYAIVRGIFRKACDAALRSVLAKQPNQATKRAIDFDRKYELLAEQVQNKLLEEGEYQLATRNGGYVMVDAISNRGNFRIKHHEGTRIYSVGKDRLTKLHLGLKERDSEMTNVHDTFRDIIGGSNSSAYWAVLNAVRNYKPSNEAHQPAVAVVPTSDIISTLTPADYNQPNIDRHVLIIDEINRGNVSAILGELITLLEPDKRLGAPEELTVTLPYSRDEFGVPPNLHIIGTMNTADRSVEALDAALRRRFVFEEVPPRPLVIADVLDNDGRIEVAGKTVDLVRLLELLNQRIAALKDRNHLLGHSYFLKIKNWRDLRHVFADRVIPLLREYFFANYTELQLVIGEGFCRAELAETTSFAKLCRKPDFDAEERTVYHFPRPETAEELLDCLHKLGYPWAD